MTAQDAWVRPRISLGKLLLKQDNKAAAKHLLEAALQLAIAQDHKDRVAELTEITG